MGKGAEIYFVIHAILIVTCLVPEIFSVNFGNKPKYKIMFLWSLFFTIFAGIRWENGTDWYQYLYHFRYSSFENVFNYSRDFGGDGTLEWLFVFLNALVNKLTGEFWVYNILTAGFIQFTQYYVIKKLCPSRPLLLYCLLMVNDTSYFAVRSQLSTGVGLWCYWFYKQYCDYGRFEHLKMRCIGAWWMYLKNCKLAHFLTAWYAAYSIHNQSVVLLPMVVAGKIRFNTYVYLIVASLVFGFSDFFQTNMKFLSSHVGGAVGAKFVHYTDFVTDGGGGEKGLASVIIYLAFAGVFLVVREKENLVKDEWYNAMLNLYLVWCAIYVVFSGAMSDLVRLSYQFNFARLILMVSAFQFFYKMKYKKMKVFIWIVYIIYIVSRYRHLDDWYYFYQANVPYKTILGI